MKKELQRFDLYRKVSITFNVLGIGAVPLFFWHDAPAWFVTAAMILPLLTMIVVKLSRGVIHFNYRETTPNPSIGFVIIVCSIGLTVNAIMNYNMLDYGKLWTHVAWVTLIVWILFLASTSEFNYRYSLDIANAVSFCLFLIMYGFGSYTISNCLFDGEPSEKLTTTIIDKNIVENSRHRHSYFVEIAAVGPIETSKIEVTEAEYKRAETDLSIQVNLKNGVWGIPWYYIEVDKIKVP